MNWPIFRNDPLSNWSFFYFHHARSDQFSKSSNPKSSIAKWLILANDFSKWPFFSFNHVRSDLFLKWSNPKLSIAKWLILGNDFSKWPLFVIIIDNFFLINSLLINQYEKVDQISSLASFKSFWRFPEFVFSKMF